jgi:hypothetical protein
MKASKIKNLTRVRIKGKLYEWNDVFGAYWSVEGKPGELQEEDLKDVDKDNLDSATWNENDH